MKIHFGHRTTRSTELLHDFCAGIGLLQLGVVLVFITICLSGYLYSCLSDYLTGCRVYIMLSVFQFALLNVCLKIIFLFIPLSASMCVSLSLALSLCL